MSIGFASGLTRLASKCLFPTLGFLMKISRVSIIAVSGALCLGLAAFPAQATPADGALDIKVELGDSQKDASTYMVYERQDVVPGPGPEVGPGDLVQNPSSYGGDVPVDIRPGGRRVVVGNSEVALNFNLVRITIEADYIRNLTTVSDDLFGDLTSEYDRTVTQTAKGIVVTWVQPDGHWYDTVGNSVFAWQPVTFGTAKVRIIGQTAVGKKVKAGGISLVSLTPQAARINYQWLRGKKKIKGATKKVYRVKRADRGKRIRVRATARAYGVEPSTFMSKAVRIKRR